MKACSFLPASGASPAPATRARLTFITGGARSGKSRYAEELALQSSDRPIYVATARIWDEEFRGRVEKHRSHRDGRWTLIEEEKHLGRLPLEGRTVVIDCVTLWITNFFSDLKADVDACLEVCKREMDQLLTLDATLFIISNEIGMGLHADTESGRKFTDLQGWLNQYIAGKAGEVIFMVSGIPLTVRSSKQD
jgi:adenosylcobinamide kinase / adenosylcobinamide-phosphate guanylyltransferase